MRTAATALALVLTACTSPAAPVAGPSASPTRPSRPPSVAPSPAPARLAYPVDLAPGARHTLVAAQGKIYLLDDAGRIVSTRRMPGGGYPAFTRGDDGKTYAIVRYDAADDGLYTYAAGRFTLVSKDGGYYPLRFVSRGVRYRQSGTTLSRLAPRTQWQLPYLDDFAPDAKGFLGGGRDLDAGTPLVVVTMPSGPVVVTASDARCAITDPAGGRQNVIDAPAPYHWEFCPDAAIGPNGNLVLVARDAGGYPAQRRDRLVVIEADPVSLSVLRRTVVRSVPESQQQAGQLLALPGGLAAYLHDPYGDCYVLDLRGPKPVAHVVPNVGNLVTAAGPDALFVWGDGKTVARITVSTGRVERTALRLPGYVTGVVRVP
jgi:hypothetical protein